MGGLGQIIELSEILIHLEIGVLFQSDVQRDPIESPPLLRLPDQGRELSPGGLGGSPSLAHTLIMGLDSQLT
ncbi:MAG: hypothetical protein CL878_02730 [Dehalococcoidia bacterium]|nr:hypothetical protein [Dehalococcoidia bacterium]